MEEMEKKTPESADKSAAVKDKKAEKKNKGESRVARFFRSYRSEIKKIVWCPWKQVRKNSFVVIVSVVICSAAICALDFVFSKGIIALGSLI